MVCWGDNYKGELGRGFNSSYEDSPEFDPQVRRVGSQGRCSALCNPLGRGLTCTLTTCALCCIGGTSVVCACLAW